MGSASTDLRRLYVEEAPRLLRYFGRRSVSADDRSDLVQEAFLRYLRVGVGASKDRPVGYLYRIARNLLFDRTRQQQRRAPYQADEPLCETSLCMPADQAHALEATQLMTRYEQAVDSLAPRTREVFLLHRVDELSYREIAERLGIGLRTVEWHIAEALVKIRQTLDEDDR